MKKSNIQKILVAIIAISFSANIYAQGGGVKIGKSNKPPKTKIGRTTVSFSTYLQFLDEVDEAVENDNYLANILGVAGGQGVISGDAASGGSPANLPPILQSTPQPANYSCATANSIGQPVCMTLHEVRHKQGPDGASCITQVRFTTYCIAPANQGYCTSVGTPDGECCTLIFQTDWLIHSITTGQPCGAYLSPVPWSTPDGHKTGLSEYSNFVSEPYPNPVASGNSFNIPVVAESGNEVNVAIYDLVGRKVIEKNFVQSIDGIEAYPISTNDINSGNYIISVTINGRIGTSTRLNIF